MENNIYVLYGEDSYLVKEELQKIVDEHSIEPEAIEFFDAEETPFEEAIQSALTIPFLTEMKLVAVHNCKFLSSQKIQNDEDTLLKKYIETTNPTTIFVLIVPENTMDKKKNIVKYLLDYTTVISCQKVENEDYYSKIKKLLQDQELTIDANALQQFLSRTSYNLQVMMNELDKLILFSKEKGHITIDMVREVTTRNLEENIFNLVNAILAKDQILMMSIYLDLVVQNVDPVWMTGVIISKFQEILYTQELLSQKKSFEDIMKYFQASKGRVYYMTKNARETDSQTLFEYISKLEKLDYEIKSGQIDKFVGLEMLLYKMF